MSKITNYLYLGDIRSLSQYKSLEIDTIITILHFKPTLSLNVNVADNVNNVTDNNVTNNVTNNIANNDTNNNAIIVQKQIEHIYFNAEDEDDFEIEKYFDECIKILEQNEINNKKTLVHCYSGVSRSATLVVAYLIYKNMKNKKFKKAVLKYLIIQIISNKNIYNSLNFFLTALSTVLKIISISFLRIFFLCPSIFIIKMLSPYLFFNAL